MTPTWITRLRHLILGPGKHWKKRKKPDPKRLTAQDIQLMFSGQSSDTKYYPEKNGVSREVRFW